jgi:hypothetical protein
MARTHPWEVGDALWERVVPLIPVLATSDIRSKKCVTDDAIRPFSAPSLQQADGHRAAHCGVYCPVLERISEVASTRVIKRTNAWITHQRPLSRDFEGTHSSSEALFIYLDMSKLMGARQARDHP